MHVNIFVGKIKIETYLFSLSLVKMINCLELKVPSYQILFIVFDEGILWNIPGSD